MKAFPKPFIECGDSQRGMDLRDYFAAAALQGMISSFNPKELVTPSDVCKNAYHYADAMMKAREL